MSSYNISVIHGDGIGPEVGVEGVRALTTIGQVFGHTFSFKEYLAGGAAIDATGGPMPDATIKGVKDSHALLFGAIGGPKWESMPHHLKPEAGLLKIRKELGAFANSLAVFILDLAALPAMARTASALTRKSIPRQKLNALAAWHLTPLACVKRKSVRSIKPTC